MSLSLRQKIKNQKSKIKTQAHRPTSFFCLSIQVKKGCCMFWEHAFFHSYHVFLYCSIMCQKFSFQTLILLTKNYHARIIDLS